MYCLYTALLMKRFRLIIVFCIRSFSGLGKKGNVRKKLYFKRTTPFPHGSIPNMRSKKHWSGLRPFKSENKNGMAGRYKKLQSRFSTLQPHSGYSTSPPRTYLHINEQALPYISSKNSSTLLTYSSGCSL